MYFRRQGSGDEVHLFDGDRIAVLAALLVMDLLKSLPSAEQRPPTVRAAKTPLCSQAPLHCQLAGTGADRLCMHSRWPRDFPHRHQGSQLPC